MKNPPEVYSVDESYEKERTLQSLHRHNDDLIYSIFNVFSSDGILESYFSEAKPQEEEDASSSHSEDAIGPDEKLAPVTNESNESLIVFEKSVEENPVDQIELLSADSLTNVTYDTEKLEENLEKRICAAFIQHLEDESMEVKSNAVKCI